MDQAYLSVHYEQRLKVGRTKEEGIGQRGRDRERERLKAEYDGRQVRE